ncbi:hypothetical protein JTE90_015897 [Oedothorax gibbosus]|uniref:Uncharacterized protein n=1 Tax=Oedothorax gibbosus TaxID=931172 RepID=A0AAV6VUZ6_9ARAC|nr:hypothetical protein JTE90_015897 [Oedothorax gibbosus]
MKSKKKRVLSTFDSRISAFLQILAPALPGGSMIETVSLHTIYLGLKEAAMKTLFIQLIIGCLLIDLVFAQQLELTLKKKALIKTARKIALGKDKKFIKYGLGAATKGTKGAVQGIIGKPVKLVGVLLGPLGIPLKLIGTVLETKSVLNKAKAVVYTVKKFSRDSVRYG